MLAKIENMKDNTQAVNLEINKVFAEHQLLSNSFDDRSVQLQDRIKHFIEEVNASYE